MSVITSLVVEHGAHPSSIAVPRPRLSWASETATGDWLQHRAELELDGAATAVIEGRDSVLVDWPFDAIAPHARHSLRVRVTGVDGIVGEWSDPVAIEAAFLADGEWIAQLLEHPQPERDAQPLRLRHEFEVASGLVRATLFATALGVYQASINGRPVDDQLLKPGWTPYAHRLIHESTDVTDLLRKGESNAIGLDVAGGWYTEHWFVPQPRYGSQPSAAAQLRLEFADGSVETVATGEHWRSSLDGPITASGLYDGEHRDERLETPGWDLPGFDDSDWDRVRFTRSVVVPTARTSPAVRVTQQLAVTEVLTSPSGATILDFGQNLVGRLRLRVRGPEGAVLRVRHAEVLEHGEMGMRPLRAAKATDTLTLSGSEVEWAVLHTFHGFRYAEISGLPIEDVEVVAEVVHSDMRRTGWFESSHELLDRLHENVVWGMRGNFLYLPTDCPQRDERLGWTGDIQVFAPTAGFLFDTRSFLASWLTDLAIEQREAGGNVPYVIPNVIHLMPNPSAAWGDAATVVPSVLHERFADVGVLVAQFESMRAWTDLLLDRVDERGLWGQGYQFGDWLDPTAPPDDAFKAMTDPLIVGTAYLARSAQLTSRAAALIGETDEAERFARAAEKARGAFIHAFVGDDGRMSSDAQTAYALAIAFDLVRDARQRAALGDRLAELVMANAHHIGTGFVGTPIITDALAATGHLDTAGRLLLETTSPSWLHPVTMGATTIWERWDSMLEDGSINPGEMTSFNHYALGAVADWLHRSVAGLSPAEPGYKVTRVAPRPIAGLEYAAARLHSPYGPVSVAWRRTGDRIVVEAVVPPNTTAEVELPNGEPFMVGSGVHSWEAGA